MDHLSSNSPTLVSFKQIYLQNISPKLEALDLFIKTSNGNFSPSETATILGTSLEEVLLIMNQHAIHHMSLIDLFTIIAQSSSYICGLVRRQWKYAATPLYTPYMIAYIYELNIDKVQAAFNQQEKEYILESELMELFSLIQSPIYQITTRA